MTTATGGACWQPLPIMILTINLQAMLVLFLIFMKKRSTKRIYTAIADDNAFRIELAARRADIGASYEGTKKIRSYFSILEKAKNE